MNEKELINECNSLLDNVNRIMVTDEQEEMFAHFIYAIHRIEKIFSTRFNEVLCNQVKIMKEGD